MSPSRASGLFVAQRLTENGHRALFAGGCVRDRLLGVEPADYDVATDATPDHLRSLFTRRVEVGARFGVVIISDGGTPVEVATFRADGCYQDGRRPESVTYSNEQDDARRRDFTINGMFLDPITDELFDYVGGQADLKAKVVRAIGDPAARFSEDRLRLLRAVRFAARLGFAIDPATGDAIQRHAEALTEVSAERIGEELVKMMTGPNPDKALALMDQYGLLEVVLPEISAMKGVEQPPNYHPEGDVFVHTLLCMSKLNNPSIEEAFGTLLHDVAKPVTFVRADRIRYTKHEAVGAGMAQKICERLRFSSKQADTIAWLVKKHLIFKDMKKMRLSKVKRLLSDERFEALAEVSRADALGSNGDLTDYEYCKAMLRDLSDEEVKPTPLVTGHDLIALGLKPGPQFTILLEEAYNIQLEGGVITREQALERLSGSVANPTDNKSKLLRGKSETVGGVKWNKLTVAFV